MSAAHDLRHAFLGSSICVLRYGDLFFAERINWTRIQILRAGYLSWPVLRKNNRYRREALRADGYSYGAVRKAKAKAKETMAQESLEFVYRYKEINKVVSSENVFAKEKLKKN
jgi:hypothetical protein